MNITLRDHVASELGKLPGARTLALHTLVSSPQRDHELFPYIHNPQNHKVMIQNILLLVSENSEPDATTTTADTTTTTPRILSSALEATLYLFPTTSSSILYIGKIDTTGFSKISPSPARTLARATIDYFVRPDTRPPECGQRVWVHLFARAQSQYLFPDSAVWKEKRVLGDAGLVRWWWSLFGDVARDVAEVRQGQADERFKGTYLWYILPGFTDLEAYHTLASGSSFKVAQSGELPWKYGHPYEDPSTVFPLSGVSLDSEATKDNPSRSEDLAKLKSIAYLIPTFPDDPKARFLGEIASTTSETDMPPPPPRATSKPTSPTAPNSKLSNNSSPRGPGSVLSSPSQSPFKKRRRMDGEINADKLIHSPPGESAKQEGAESATVEGTVTQSTPSTPPKPETTPLSDQSATTSSRALASSKHMSHAETELVRRGRQALSAVSAKEFWERMGFRQECALGAVTAFFVAMFEDNSAATSGHESKISKEYISLPTHTRIIQSLMNHAFSTPEKAVRSTHLLETSIRTLCDGAVPVVDAPTTEPDTFYYKHIYKALVLNNPPLLPREAAPAQPAVVNVLQVKRKARR